MAPLQVADAMARPQGGDGATYVWLLKSNRHLPGMRVGVQDHLIRCAAFETAKHRQTVTTEYRRTYGRGLFHLHAAPVDMHVLERWCVHTAKHPEHFGFYAFA